MNSRVLLVAAFWGAVLLLAILFAFRPAGEQAPGANLSTLSADHADQEPAARRPTSEAGAGATASDYMNGPMAEEKHGSAAPAIASALENPAAPMEAAASTNAAAPLAAQIGPNNPRAGIAVECWGVRGSAPRDFAITLDREVRTSGEASALISSRRATSGYVTMFQSSSAGQVKGRRVEFSADVRTRGAKGSANLLLRAEDAYGNTVAFDNMVTSYDSARRPDKLYNRGVVGDSEWSTQHVVVDIPPEAAVITYGMSVFGEGKAWIDNARLEVVSPEMPTTAVDIRESPAPVNNIPVDPAALSRIPKNLEFDVVTPGDVPACN